MHVNPELNVLAIANDFYYSGRNLGVSGQPLLGASEELFVGALVCQDVGGIPADIFGKKTGGMGWVTKPQTENVNFPVGIVTRLSKPNRPGDPQVVTVMQWGIVKAQSNANAATGNNGTTGVPSATPTPLFAVADQWYVDDGPTSGIDTPAELTNHIGYAVEIENDNGAPAFRTIRVQPRCPTFPITDG